MYIADVKCRTREEFYVLARKMQELNIKWVTGLPFTANDAKWKVYKSRTWFTFGQSGSNPIHIYYGCDFMTSNILSIEHIKSVHSLQEFQILIHSL